MRTSRSAIVLLSTVIGLLTFSIASGCNTPPQVAPVDYSSLMRDVGERYKDLYVAAQQEKWEFADFQAKKIRVLMSRAAAIHPASARDTNNFIQEAYPGIIDAISSRDHEQFEAEYGSFATMCNTCHVAQNVGYLSLTIPTMSDSPILDAGLLAVGGEADPTVEPATEEEVKGACTVCHTFDRVEQAAYEGDAWKDLIGRMVNKGAAVPEDKVESYAAFLDSLGG